MTEPVVSILMPTIRPGLFRLRISEMVNLCYPGPCEVVTVSDLPDLDVFSPHSLLEVRNFVQPRLGTVRAMNLAFEKARGRYVFATNDESQLHPEVLTSLVRAANATSGDVIWSVVQTPYCSNDYYGILFATCPFGSREMFRRLNDGEERLFDPTYRCFYADPDLALRAHAVGVPVVRVPEAKSTHHTVFEADGHASNWAAYYHSDRSTFVTRWAHLGPPPIDPSLR